MKHQRKQPEGRKGPTKSSLCYCCNGTNHLPKDCYFETAECHHCRKRGHIAPACRNKEKSAVKAGPQQKHKIPHKANQLSTGGDSATGEEPTSDSDQEDTTYELFAMPSARMSPIAVDQGGYQQCQGAHGIDTGASASVMSESTYHQVWEGHGPPIQPSQAKLRTYSGEHLKVLGAIDVQVKYKEQTKSLTLLVMSGKGPTLLGRDWLHQINLDWHAIFTLTSPPSLDTVLEMHANIFGDDLGVTK